MLAGLQSNISACPQCNLVCEKEGWNKTKEKKTFEIHWS